MGLDIVSNNMATEASNNISTNEANMQSSLQKLSSGYQINSPADDASGYVISQHLQAQIGGFQQAQANTQAGINVVQTADGALNEVSTILQRINTLAVQSANTSATDGTAQQAAQDEVNQALTSIANIAQTTVYGNNQLLVNGTNSSVNFTFQVGDDDTSSSQVAFSVTALNLANLGLVNDSLTLGASAGTDGVASVSGTGLAVGSTYNVVLASVSATSGEASSTGVVGFSGASFAVGATAETFSLSVNGGTAVTITLSASTTYNMAALQTTINTQLAAAGSSAVTVNVSAAGTFNITDTTAGAATSVAVGGTAGNLTALGLTAGSFAGSATTASVAVNGGTAVTLTTLQNVAGGTVNYAVNGSTVTLTLSAPLSAGTFMGTADYSNYGSLNTVNFSITSSTAIATITNAIQTVTSIGGTLGAAQNELTDISDNESVMVQNLQSSNASIQDTDMASQMVMFTQDQTLVQAGVSMLAQANQIPQYVLKLLS
jgi:flagellin